MSSLEQSESDATMTLPVVPSDDNSHIEVVPITNDTSTTTTEGVLPSSSATHATS